MTTKCVLRVSISNRTALVTRIITSGFHVANSPTQFHPTLPACRPCYCAWLAGCCESIVAVHTTVWGLGNGVWDNIIVQYISVLVLWQLRNDCRKNQPLNTDRYTIFIAGQLAIRWSGLQYVPQCIHTSHALLCFVVVSYWLILCILFNTISYHASALTHWPLGDFNKILEK